MNAAQSAKVAYGAADAPTRTPRAVEYTAFARATKALRDAARRPRWDPAMAEALHTNRRLWTVLAAAVADSGNQMDADLRARIFYLAQFTHEHSRKVLSGADTVVPLLQVNAAVMRGLRQTGQPT